MLSKQCINEEGFTLLEVMLVILIIGFAAVSVVSNYVSTIWGIRDETNELNMVRINKAIELFRSDLGKNPDTLDDLCRRPDDEVKWRGPYLDKIPQNPFGSDSKYILDPKGKLYLEKYENKI